jgi:hypothetical protein
MTLKTALRNVALWDIIPCATFENTFGNMKNNGNGWKLEVGYQGKRFWVFQDNWEVCIYEDLCARRARFCVLEMSELQSRHEELTGPKGAKAAVLIRLIELAKQA